MWLKINNIIIMNITNPIHSYIYYFFTVAPPSSFFRRIHIDSQLSEQSGACAALRALGPLQQQSTRDPKLSYPILQMTVGPRGTLCGMLRSQQCACANIPNALPSSRTYGSWLYQETLGGILHKNNFSSNYARLKTQNFTFFILDHFGRQGRFV